MNKAILFIEITLEYMYVYGTN